jgi:hypothetical protein
MITDFLARYALNLFFTFLVIRFIYYPKYRNKDFVFTFFLFNSILFVLCFLLAEADLKFIEDARKAIKQGYKVFYTSSY